MTTNTLAHPAGVEVLAQVVRLLCRCTDLALEKVQDQPMSDLAALGLGAALLADEAMALLPADADAGSDAIDAVVAEPVVGYDDPRQVLRAAEVLTWTLPMQVFPPGTSRVVVRMCDLLREHPS